MKTDTTRTDSEQEDARNVALAWFGGIYQEVDGFYYYDPPAHGSYAAHTLREIAAKLDEINDRIAPPGSLHAACSAADWQPIETAPENTTLMLYCPYRHESNYERFEVGIASGGRYYEDGTRAQGTWSHHAWATHWAKLPSPPNDKVSHTDPTTTNADTECKKCGQIYNLHYGYEPTPYCDCCAQETVEKLERENAELRGDIALHIENLLRSERECDQLNNKLGGEI
jgi:hypothetical protein